MSEANKDKINSTVDWTLDTCVFSIDSSSIFGLMFPLTAMTHATENSLNDF